MYACAVRANWMCGRRRTWVYRAKMLGLPNLRTLNFVVDVPRALLR